VFQDFPEADAAERAAARVHEQPRRRASFQQLPPRLRRIPPESSRSLLADRHEPLLASFRRRSVVLVEVQVGEPDATSSLTRRPVAYSSSIIARSEGRASSSRRVARSACRLVDRQEPRERGPGPRRTEIAAGCCRDAGRYEKAVEAAHRRDGAGHRPRGQPAPALFANEHFEALPVQRLDGPAGAGA